MNIQFHMMIDEAILFGMKDALWPQTIRFKLDVTTETKFLKQLRVSVNLDAKSELSE